MLSIISPVDHPKGRWRYSVRCDCGRESIAYVSHLKSGATRSCKCKMGPLKHGGMLGGKASPEYRVWAGMKNRCLDPANPGYPGYGGRGIGIHPRWLDFANFLADMGKKPSPRHSIDRINNDGNYEPGNCRWATSREQTRNTRRNVKVNDLCLKDACALTGITYAAAQKRIRKGESPEQAVAHPMKKLRTIGGVPLIEAAKRAGLSYDRVWWRLRRGWSEEQALGINGRPYHRTRERIYARKSSLD